jgi:hypothetical protein
MLGHLGCCEVLVLLATLELRAFYGAAL